MSSIILLDVLFAEGPARCTPPGMSEGNIVHTFEKGTLTTSGLEIQDSEATKKAYPKNDYGNNSQTFMEFRHHNTLSP
jgi:hypothetical protein